MPECRFEGTPCSTCGSPYKPTPNLTTTICFGGLKYKARNCLPTYPVLCSPPPFYPILAGTYPFCGESSSLGKISLRAPPPRRNCQHS